MTHRSRIAGFTIGTDEEALQTAALFWGAAAELPVPETRDLRGLAGWLCREAGIWRFELQAPSLPAPAQLEIETDNIEAEAARLEELGARRVGHLRDRWWVLEMPSGQRFRVSASCPSHLAPDAFLWA